MTPPNLEAANFALYAPEARRLATEYLMLLAQLPLPFLPLLLREVKEYDWKFPVERRALERQLGWLDSLDPVARRRELAAFSNLKLSRALEAADWVNAPGRFSEQLTAWLWTSRQMDSFREASVRYVDAVDRAIPHDPLPAGRLGVVLIGRGASESERTLFKKLRPHGVCFRRVDPRDGLELVLDSLTFRARRYPAPFAHWYIDGGVAERAGDDTFSRVSYDGLASARAALLERIRKLAQNGSGGPEGVMSALAQVQPEQIGLAGEPVLNRFQTELLTQGSGTQIFSTTFVQWAARECLRRAQPLTLLVRFSPRQRERPMNELLAGAHPDNEVDAEGSLVDADMGAYYTWLNQQRLSESERSSFLVWFEGHAEALAIAPTMPKGEESTERLNLHELIATIG